MGLVPCPEAFGIFLFTSLHSSILPPSCLPLPFSPSPPGLPGVHHSKEAAPLTSQNPGWWVDLLKAAPWVGLLPLGTAWATSIRLVLNSPLHSGTGWEPPSWSGSCLGEPQTPAFLPEGPGATESRS